METHQNLFLNGFTVASLDTNTKECAAEPLPARNLYERIRARFAQLGGADDLQLPPRVPDREPPAFD